MATPQILEDPLVRHYLPPTKPHIRINFFNVTDANTISILPRVLELDIAATHPTEKVPRETRNLLSKSILELIAEAELRIERRNEMKEEIKKKTAKDHIERMEDHEDLPQKMNKNLKIEETKERLLSSRAALERDTSALWVDKYFPRCFTELLTEERTNREILTWLKSWDKIVFPEKVKAHLQPLSKNLSPITSSFSGKNKKPFNYAEYRQRELNCDAHKVLLIAGPPGVGKSTLARVLAHHCGYKTIEINASDERTKDKLREKLFDATQINQINLTNKKAEPHCLILDEIDGAQGGESRGAINALVEFITDKRRKGKGNVKKRVKEKKEIGDKEEADDINNEEINESKLDVEEPSKYYMEKTLKGESNQTKSKQTIKRPVICICNEAYGKHMIELRKIALVYHIKQMDESRMAEALTNICVKERISINPDVIYLLCRQSNSDMRSCINVLQLASRSIVSSPYRKLTKEHLFLHNSANTLNSKDSFQGVFDIWQEILTTSIVKKGSSTLKHIRHLLSETDNRTLILDGIYHNCLNNEGANINTLSDYYELQELYNIQENLAYKTQSFELMAMGYLPAAFFAANLATFEKVNIEFPSKLHEIKKLIKENENILATMKESNPDWVKYGHNLQDFHMDMLYYIFELIQPRIRELHMSLLRDNEMKTLTFSLLLMLKFGISFNYKFGKDENNERAFEPNFEKLLSFTGMPKIQRITEKMILTVASEYERQKAKINLPEKESYHKKTTAELAKANDKMLMPGYKRSLHDLDSKDKFPIFYKYKEGCNVGVRRNITTDFFFQ